MTVEELIGKLQTLENQKAQIYTAPAHTIGVFPGVHSVNDRLTDCYWMTPLVPDPPEKNDGLVEACKVGLRVIEEEWGMKDKYAQQIKAALDAAAGEQP
jgi:hypothetical protein